MNVIVQFDTNKIANKISRNLTAKSQPALDNQVLKDSNYHIPFDVGTLRDSGINGSVIGKGIVRWDAPYAHSLYYGSQALNTSSKEGNPNARHKWFEVAKASKIKDWLKVVQRANSR